MPPKRLTEEGLQDLLGHVKVRVDPAFDRALQAQLRAQVRELRTASEASFQSSQPARDARFNGPAVPTNDGPDQGRFRGWGFGRLNTLNLLSSVVLGAAALALVFLVLVRPMLGRKAIELNPGQEATGIPIRQTGMAPVTMAPTEEAITSTPADTPTPGPIPTDTPPPTLTPTETALPAATDTPVPTPTPTDTPVPTPTPTETAVPTGTATPPLSWTPTWTPTIGPTFTPSAIPTPVVVVQCSSTQVTGYVQLAAPYVRVTVSTSAFPITQIGEATGPVQPDGSFSVTVSYPAQPTGTHLIGGYGEWDGTTWLRPATTFGADCTGG